MKNLSYSIVLLAAISFWGCQPAHQTGHGNQLHSPSNVSNEILELGKKFIPFYHDFPTLKDRNQSQHNGPFGAGVLVFSEINGKNYVLVAREGGGKSRGQWSLMFGSRDPGEAIEDTAIRELYEESAGIYSVTLKQLETCPLSPGHKIFMLKREYIKAEVFEAASRSAFLPEFSEMDKYAWISLNSLVKEIRQHKTQPRKSQFPSGFKTIVVRDLEGKKKTLKMRSDIWVELFSLENQGYFHNL